MTPRDKNLARIAFIVWVAIAFSLLLTGLMTPPAFLAWAGVSLGMFTLMFIIVPVLQI